MKTTQLQRFLLIVAALLPNNALASKTSYNAASIRRNGNSLIPQTINKRGGALKSKKKKLSLFGMFRIPDMNSKSTDVQTRSTIVEGSEDVDVQYRRALIKTLLTVASAGMSNQT